VQGQSRLGTQAAIVRQVLKPGLARRNNGHLGHGEHAIEKDEQNNKDNIHQDRQHRSGYGLHCSGCVKASSDAGSKPPDHGAFQGI
jgi:hypothetical protein